jgi:hypothetical protein
VTLEPGKSLTLRYAAWPHGAESGREQIDAVFQLFAKE